MKLKLVNAAASRPMVNPHGFSSVVGTMAVGVGQPSRPSPVRAPLLTPTGGQRRPRTVGFPSPGASCPRARHQPHQRPRGEAPSNFLALKRLLRDLDKTRASCSLMCFTKGALCPESTSSGAASRALCRCFRTAGSQNQKPSGWLEYVRQLPSPSKRGGETTLRGEKRGGELCTLRKAKAGGGLPENIHTCC